MASSSFSSSLEITGKRQSLLAHAEFGEDLERPAEGTRARRSSLFCWILPPLRRCCLIIPLHFSLILLSFLFALGAFMNVFLPHRDVQLLFLSFSAIIENDPVVLWLDFTFWILCSLSSLSAAFLPSVAFFCASFCYSSEVFCFVFKIVLSFATFGRSMWYMGSPADAQTQADLTLAAFLLLVGSPVSFHLAHCYWSYREHTRATDGAAPPPPSVRPSTLGKSQYGESECSRRISAASTHLPDDRLSAGGSLDFTHVS